MSLICLICIQNYIGFQTNIMELNFLENKFSAVDTNQNVIASLETLLKG